MEHVRTLILLVKVVEAGELGHRKSMEGAAGTTQNNARREGTMCNLTPGLFIPPSSLFSSFFFHFHTTIPIQHLLTIAEDTRHHHSYSTWTTHTPRKDIPRFPSSSTRIPKTNRKCLIKSPTNHRQTRPLTRCHLAPPAPGPTTLFPVSPGHSLLALFSLQSHG